MYFLYTYLFCFPGPGDNYPQVQFSERTDIGCMSFLLQEKIRLNLGLHNIYEKYFIK